ncbi:MAG: response regulator [Acidobacteria bacterium]|nr:response regulator [Acidobacteriota bacterium]
MNILIADDDATNRTILVKFLEKWGYTVTIATDGAQAWEILQAPGAPNIALLDWMMPGMDGVEVCRRLRILRPTPYTYLILLSAKFQKQEILDGLNAGADDYITKPFSPNELAARLRSGCRIVELQDELVKAREALQLQVSRDPPPACGAARPSSSLWNRRFTLPGANIPASACCSPMPIISRR